MLTEVRWFAALSEPTKKRALRFVKHGRYRKERPLFFQEDAAVSAYIVTSGLVRRIKWRTDGDSFMLGRALPGDWLGLPESLAGGGYLYDAVPEVETTCAVVQASDLPFLMELAEFRDCLVQDLAGGYFSLHNFLESRSTDDRIVRHLALLLNRPAERDPATGHVTLRMTQDALAEELDLSRETVNRHLACLQKKGLIRVARGRLLVLKPGALRAETGEGEAR